MYIYLCISMYIYIHIYIYIYIYIYIDTIAIVFTFMNVSCHTEGLSHITHMNGSWHANYRVKFLEAIEPCHLYESHVSIESCHSRGMRHVAHINVSCHTQRFLDVPHTNLHKEEIAWISNLLSEVFCAKLWDTRYISTRNPICYIKNLDSRIQNRDSHTHTHTHTVASRI